MRIILGLGLAAGLVASAAAGEVAREQKTLKGQLISLHVHPFLKDDELKVLRLVQTNPQALQLFVTSAGGFSAIAVAPQDGLLRDGGFPPTVYAIGDLPDAQTAATTALAGCDALRKGGEPCVIVLEVGPAR